MNTENCRAWVEVDLAAVQRNALTLAARAGVPLIAMVKADAYGIGALRVVEALDAPHVWGFGVATAEEGAELRATGCKVPVLVFTPVLPGEFEELRRHQLTPALGDPAVIARWVSASAAPWHLSIDTGMNRAGLRPGDLQHVFEPLRRNPPQGVFTHFHSAEWADGSKEGQEHLFRAALALLPARPELAHVENSAALARRGRSEWDLARPGIFLYGVGSGEGAQVHPEGVVAVRGRIVELHQLAAGDTVSYNASYIAQEPRIIATVPVGYADGYRRSLSRRGVALLNGRTVPVVGTVTMDMTMLDVTATNCQVGDVVTLMDGRADPNLSVETVSGVAGVSPYEMLTGLGQRLTRVYV